MYWPMGAARIYSANRTRRKGHNDHELQEEREFPSNDSNALLGLRTSRSGHLLTTITATSITIWQAS
ncbi:MAG: hypothetical protein Q9178_000494, partial [Gyalolechia marmorata]